MLFSYHLSLTVYKNRYSNGFLSPQTLFSNSLEQIPPTLSNVHHLLHQNDVRFIWAYLLCWSISLCNHAQHEEWEKHDHWSWIFTLRQSFKANYRMSQILATGSSSNNGRISSTSSSFRSLILSHLHQGRWDNPLPGCISQKLDHQVTFLQTFRVRFIWCSRGSKVNFQHRHHQDVLSDRIYWRHHFIVKV